MVKFFEVDARPLPAGAEPEVECQEKGGGRSQTGDPQPTDIPAAPLAPQVGRQARFEPFGDRHGAHRLRQVFVQLPLGPVQRPALGAVGQVLVQPLGLGRVQFR